VILADSSAWVDLLRGTGRGFEVSALLLSDTPLVATEPVLMELLAGARSDQEYERVRDLVMSVGWIAIDPASDFEAAAKIYASCRRKGITPRGLTDCLIAAVAMRAGASLLSGDKDFESIASVVPLSLI
jgi:predicted nucleic acid-binding protein